MRDESKIPACLRTKLPPVLEKIRYGTFKPGDFDYPIHLYLKEDDLRVDESGSDVISFLRGKNVLVTGATGFLGKLLIEKLLRCCKDIGTIYIIVRTKKDKKIEERVDEFLNNWVFIKLEHIYPDFRKKVVGISGDFEEDGLGLSEESRKLIKQKVNIIFNVAATVRFDEKLKKAVRINIKGTQEMLKIAKECQKLEVFTHVSTAYSNCVDKVIKEEVMPPYMPAENLIEITETLSSDIVDKITPGLIHPCPNTYVFTKQITEDLIRRNSSGIPICIQRPSIVIASVREPVRSWVDNIFGPVGLIMAAVLGLLHTMMGNSRGKFNGVPVDYCINNCIVATYKTAKERLTNNVQLFNYTCPDSNVLMWKGIQTAGEFGLQIGGTQVLKYGFFKFTKCWYWFRILNFILHTVPGKVIDFILVRLGHQPQLDRAYSKINKFTDVLSHFTMNEWTFEYSNTIALWDSINVKDKEIFPFDMSHLNWRDYFSTYLIAMREFLVLEFLDNLEQGRSYIYKLRMLHYVVAPSIALLTTYYLINTMFCFIPISVLILILYYQIPE